MKKEILNLNQEMIIMLKELLLFYDFVYIINVFYHFNYYNNTYPNSSTLNYIIPIYPLISLNNISYYPINSK